MLRGRGRRLQPERPEKLGTTHAIVPALWLLEIRNVLLTNERRNRISPTAADKFLEVLGRVDIRVQEEQPGWHTGKVLTLARQHRLTIYDATYLELAIRQGLPLATRDKELLLAAPLAGVSIFSPS